MSPSEKIRPFYKGVHIFQNYFWDFFSPVYEVLKIELEEIGKLYKDQNDVKNQL